MYTKKVYVLIVTFACFLLGSRVAVSLDMQATARSENRCKNYGICIPRLPNHYKNNGICILRHDLHSPKINKMIE